MNKRAVVIGSNSFSGSHLVALLLGRDFEVLGISRSPEPNSIFLPYKKQNQSSFVLHQMDLNKDLSQIIQVINEFSPEYVFNFAAQSMVAESWSNPEHWYQTNVVATIKLHDQLRKCKFLRKYIHISTPEVYGNCEGEVKENTNYNPSTPYAISRATADMSLMAYYKTYDFPVSFTRAANVYGPGQQLYRILPRSILYFSIGKKLSLHGGGKSVRSFIHIKDVVDGTLKVAMIGQPGEIYHFSTREQVSVKSLVERVAKKMNVSFEENVDITSDRLGKDKAYRLDFSKAKTKLDWQPKINLDNGLDDTISWVIDNLSEIENQPFEYVHKP